MILRATQCVKVAVVYNAVSRGSCRELALRPVSRRSVTITDAKRHKHMNGTSVLFDVDFYVTSNAHSKAQTSIADHLSRLAPPSAVHLPPPSTLSAASLSSSLDSLLIHRLKSSRPTFFIVAKLVDMATPKCDHQCVTKETMALHLIKTKPMAWMGDRSLYSRDLELLNADPCSFIDYSKGSYVRKMVRPQLSFASN